jgi:hypothetical protein
MVTVANQVCMNNPWQISYIQTLDDNFWPATSSNAANCHFTFKPTMKIGNNFKAVNDKAKLPIISESWSIDRMMT